MNTYDSEVLAKSNRIFGTIQQLSNCSINECAELLAELFGSIQTDLHVSAEKHMHLTAQLPPRFHLPSNYLEDMWCKAYFRPLSPMPSCFCKLCKTI